jgi:hypothetical protein
MSSLVAVTVEAKPRCSPVIDEGSIEFIGGVWRWKARCADQVLVCSARGGVQMGRATCE